MGFSLFGSRRTAEHQQQPAPVAAPAAPAVPAKSESDSALEKLAEAWKMKPADTNGKPAGPHQYFAGVDPSKIAAASKQLNFLQGIDPALMAKAQGGDAAALMEVINTSNQAAFQTAMTAIPGIIEPVLQQVEHRTTAKAPELFKQMQLRTEQPSNPILQNPAIAPIVEALKTTLATQNPQATPAQIVALAEQHMVTLGAALAPAPAQVAATANSQGSDDFSFLSR